MHALQEIGAYAGLIALLAFVVLVGLCFSMARDVRRLREWAGRAPERDAEAAARAARAAAPAAARAARVAPPVAAATPARPAAPSPPTTAAEPRPATPATVAAPPPQPAPQTAAPTAAATSAPPSPPADLPAWGERRNYRSEAPADARSRLPVFAGVAAVGIALVVALVLIVGSGGSSSRVSRARPAVAPVAQQARVAVLNATGVGGLGARVGARVRADGFTVADVGNAGIASRATSAVMYAPGSVDQARTIAARLGVARTQPVDRPTQARAGGAPVVVVVGADMSGSR